jgi:FAD:protein FMN transferase
MPSSSPPPLVERARPLLGTRVAIRVRGLLEADAHRAIDAAFREIEQVHARMSFHDPGSDLGRLNREGFPGPVAVARQTLEVLGWAERIARGSHGVFDITVAAQLVQWGTLPSPGRPSWRGRPDPRGSWRDVELLPDGTVRFRRRVWIDLGGIAKGYAVDRAIDCLRAWGVPACCVNAGGDLRVLGPRMERIHLDRAPREVAELPILELVNGSVASSGGSPDRVPHVDGRRRSPVGRRSFVSVVAPRCVVADALTKVVLARGARSEGALRGFGASAHLFRPGVGWRTLAAPR